MRAGSRIRRPQRYSTGHAARQYVKRTSPRVGAVRASTAQSLNLFSPSKINLFLRILNKRPDGYHNLASLFHVIDFGDDLKCSVLNDSEEDLLTCSEPSIPTDGTNLVNKAYELFRRHTGLQQRFQTHIKKRVPAGGGIGGGSGNAATALWAANELTGRPASNADLLAWSGEIGSDISIFFSQGAAYCTGRGEIVQPIDLPTARDSSMLLVKPPIGLSTPEIFRMLDLAQTSSADPGQLLQAMCSSGINQQLCINDLERPAFLKLPELQQLKDRLQAHGTYPAVFMSGSGSTIVCYGSEAGPLFLSEASKDGVLVQPARMLTRRANEWYRK